MPRPPPVTPYASPTTDVPLSADLPPATWRTAAAAAWLVGVLAAIGTAAVHLCDDQRTLAFALRELTAGRVSLPGLVSVAIASAEAVAFATAAGMVAAAVLYDVPVNRLAWLAAGPAAVGCWSAVMMVTSGAPGPGEVSGLAAAIATQCGLVFAGTRVGRPVARWLARRLLPPPLRVALVSLWV